MAMSVFETPRLSARRWTQDDAPAYLAIFGDAEVFRFLPGAPVASVDEARQRIQLLYDRYYGPSHGTLGAFALVEKATGAIVSNSLLKHAPGANGVLSSDVEIGWHTVPAHWRRGFAEEAARGCLAYGFERLALPDIRALVMPGNERSQGLARKLGMRPRGQTDRYYGTVVEMFVTTRDEFTSTSIP
jgi:ribosomal-protein-alanine N-acetyltransferase